MDNETLNLFRIINAKRNVIKFGLKGNFIKFFNTTGDGSLNYPTQLASDSHDNIYAILDKFICSFNTISSQITFYVQDEKKHYFQGMFLEWSSIINNFYN